jgi:hypothetical protein
LNSRRLDPAPAVFGVHPRVPSTFRGSWLLSLLVVTGCATPGPPVDRPPENIARGRPVSLIPAPDYRHCTDPDDALQLTDGQYVQGHFWTQKGTVGWNRARPAIMTVDLGCVEPVSGVSFNTAAGTAGVSWPQAIFILVSDDGRIYHEAGDLVELSRAGGEPPASGYAVHRFQTRGLRTRGRYVAFVLSTAVYGFVDEIEVYRGDPAWLDRPPGGEPVTDLVDYHRDRVTGRFIAGRIQQDANSVLAQAERVKIPEESRRRIHAALGDAVAGLGGLLGKIWPKDFRAILPLNDAHRRVFRAQADTWRSAGAPPLTAWVAGPWDPIELVTLPPSRPEGDIRMVMMRNEHRAVAVNLANATEADEEVRLSLEGIPLDANPPAVEVCEVAWTDTNQGVPVAAALPPASRDGGAWRVVVPSGLVRQVWLSFDTADVMPAAYPGALRVSGRMGEVAIAVNLLVFSERLPESPSLHLGGWDYTDGGKQLDVTPANREAVVGHLRSRFVDSPWATAPTISIGKYDDTGRMTQTPDTWRFNDWLRRWPDAGQYCIYVGAGNSFDRFPVSTPAFGAAVAEWIRFWARHAASRGLRPEQLVLLLVDEPSKPEQDAVILVWARAIRAAGTGVRIFEDPLHIDPSKEADASMLEACDVLCLHRPRFFDKPTYRAYYTTRKPAGSELAFYSCTGPVRLLDPYAYHRLQAWACWKYGAKGSYFWSFGDSGGASSWNEYASKQFAYVPFFLAPDGVTPGKHMEAIREGVEDYEYLVMLRDRIAEAEQRGAAGPALGRAKEVLAGAADRVLGTPTVDALQWSAPKDRSVADRVRIEILNSLMDLKP